MSRNCRIINSKVFREDDFEVRTYRNLDECITADSKNLGSRASCNSLFFEGHLIPASKPFESPTSANERPRRKTQRRVNLSCISWWLCNQKVRSTTRATDKVFGISCKCGNDRRPSRTVTSCSFSSEPLAASSRLPGIHSDHVVTLYLCMLLY